MLRKLTLILFIILCLLSACQRKTSETKIKETTLPIPSLESSPSTTPAPESTARPNGTLQNYETTTLEEIIKEFKAEVMQVSLGNFSLYPYPTYQVRMKYMGECREIPQNRLDRISAWTAYVNPQTIEKVLSLYKMECLFTENSEEYWMPIQTVVLEALQGDVPEGDEVDLYIRWLGVNREKIKIDWVFWIIDFLEV